MIMLLRIGSTVMALTLFCLLAIAPAPEAIPEAPVVENTVPSEVSNHTEPSMAMGCACCPRPAPVIKNSSRFPEPGNWTLEAIPVSAFREELESVEPPIRERALEQFNRFGMSSKDVDALHVGPDGSLFFACRAPAVTDTAEPVFLERSTAEGDAVIAAAGIPVESPPVYHSKPNAPYAIYLDFNGATITGSAWNSNGNTLNAYVWSKDNDRSTFSDSEQNIMRRIWQRMAEDYAPFNVNVTTDPSFDPDVTGGSNDIGWVLFTRDEDTDGEDMPARGAGGVAYVGVFGERNYARYYSPALVYADNLGPNNEHFMAEAGSHEMGHNMGLSHDGGAGKSYYPGHNAGNLRWGAIMGSSYRDDITTWTRGEYTGATQTQDDYSIIINRVGVHPDEAGNSLATAAELVFFGDSVVDPLTRAYVGDDPNEGIIESATDIDVYSFSTTGGEASFTVETFTAEDTRLSLGSNLDVKLSLLDASGNVIMTSDPQSTLSASLSTTLAAGDYGLAVEGTGVGNPMASTPTGYTEYGSLGMYFITGSAVQSVPDPSEMWRSAYFGSPANSGDGADAHDFDKDGIINLLERAFATNPTQPDSVYRPIQSFVQAESLNYLTLEYVRPAGGNGTTGVDYTRDGMTFTVEYTDDPSSNWESGEITVVSVSPPVDGMETIVVRLNTDLVSAGRQFIRLSVTGTE